MTDPTSRARVLRLTRSQLRTASAIRLAATVLVSAILLAMPLLAVSISEPGAFVATALLLLPVIHIHYWKWHEPSTLPFLVIFLAGLMTDALTAGPLGHWAFLYLSAGLVSQLVGKADADAAPLQGWIDFLLVLLLAAAGIALLMSLRRSGGPELQPLAVAYMALLALYPVVVAPSWLVRRLMTSARRRALGS